MYVHRNKKTYLHTIQRFRLRRLYCLLRPRSRNFGTNCQKNTRAGRKRPPCSVSRDQVFSVLMSLTAINLAIQYLVSRHSFLIRRHNFLKSRHNYLKLYFQSSICRLVRCYVDLTDNDVDLSDRFDFSDIMSTCQIIFFVICVALTGQSDLKINLTYLKILFFHHEKNT